MFGACSGVFATGSQTPGNPIFELESMEKAQKLDSLDLASSDGAPNPGNPIFELESVEKAEQLDFQCLEPVEAFSDDELGLA